jgi:hypothetical protein
MSNNAYTHWITTISMVLGAGAIALLPGSISYADDNREDSLTPRPIPGGVRPGDAACLITPVADGDEVAQIWSDRPFFLWKNYPRGAVRTVEVQSRYQESTFSSYLLFRVTVNGETQVSYVGTPLERGQDYEWVAYSNTVSAPQIIPFQMMPEDEYEQVAIELEAAEQEWRTAGLSPEEQVLERITFFAERGLWSDAMRVAFTVANPSGAVLDYQALVMSLACSSE